MPNVKTLQRAFNGGEVTPEFFGQIGDTKFMSGAATMRNFIALPHGPAQNRAGTEYVNEVKDSTKKTRLIPFTYSNTQTMVIELGAGYFRFHHDGGTLLAGAPPAWSGMPSYAVGDLVSRSGANYYCISAHTNQMPPNATYWYPLPSSAYEMPSPYAEADLFGVHYVQSADVMTLVHPNHAPRELRRLGATKWVLLPINFASPIATPFGLTVTPTGSGSSDYTYVVTSVSSDGFSESAASAPVSVTNNLLATGNKNDISWTPQPAAKYYNVYKLSGGVYGFMGQTFDTSIVDDNINPDFSKTPPIYESIFDAAGDYPGAVSYYEQRRSFAGTSNLPQTLWMTRSGTESNMSYSLPTRDDDRISIRVSAREASIIKHIVPLDSMILMTSSAEWRVTSINSDALTPASIAVRPQSYIGANDAQPIIINNNIIYAAARGGHVREMAYQFNAQSYVTGDLSLRAPHLFDNKNIVDLAYSKSPIPVCWFVNDAGGLLGLTYVPEQQIGAWHRHDTINGFFESCACASEGNEDVLYVVVRRIIDGVSKRYIERLHSRQFDDQKDAYFVDCGGIYNGAPATTISGLDWLEGQVVNILADGAVHPQRTVTGGAVALDQPASIVHVGLPITADLQTLPVAIQIDQSMGQGNYKNVNRAWLRVHRSGGIFVGPDPSLLVEYKQRTNEPYGSPARLKTEQVDMRLTPQWADNGQIFIRQQSPLPLTVISVTCEVALGG